MNRRTFLAAAAASIGSLAIKKASLAKMEENIQKHKFKLNYAPHFGMFKNHAGEDLIDQLKFIADVGFTALEDNDMTRRPVDEQEKIAKEMSRLGLTMGVFVAYVDFKNPTFVLNNKAQTERTVKQIQNAVEVAKRVNAKWMTVVPGAYHQGTQWDYQTANVIENLKRCAEVCEPAGVTMVLEPLNPWRDHPGLFLTKIPQAYQICLAVDSPSCKILDDLYHQQITEGNLIPNIETAWDEIAYFQLGDNPGRKEPTTGEINFKNIFKYLHEKGFKGIIGMEHGMSGDGKEGEQAVINAYIECDSF